MIDVLFADCRGSQSNIGLVFSEIVWQTIWFLKVANIIIIFFIILPSSMRETASTVS